MRNWSDLTPNLSSWINAFLLAALLIAATSLIPAIHYLFTIAYVFLAWLIYFAAILLSFVVNLLPQFVQLIVSAILSFISSIINGLITLISPFVLLLPIPIVAFAHHYLYLLLDRYYPDLSSSERGRVTGYVPGIMSWWHGLFALVVVIMAMLFSDSLLSIAPWLSNNSADCFYQIPEEVYAFSRIEFWVQIALTILRQPIYRPFMRLIIWVIAAAYLYQFEFTFKQHLIANASRGSLFDR